MGFCASAIHLLQFYKGLGLGLGISNSTKICLSGVTVSTILDQHPQLILFTFQTAVMTLVMLPLQIMQIMLTYLPDNDMNSRALLFAKQQSRKCTRQNNSQPSPTKRRKPNSYTTLPAKHNHASFPTSLNITAANRRLQHLNKFQNIIAHVLRESPIQIPSQFSSFAGSPNLAAQFSIIRPALEVIVSELNSLAIPYADTFPNITQDTCAYSLCHPLLLQILKPVQTTGDGNCMYNALSSTLTGTEHFTHVMHLLCVYALVKYKDTAFADAFPSNTQASHEQMCDRALLEALQVGAWGTDYQLFPSSLLMNRPIFQYNTFIHSDISGMVTVTLS